MRYLQKNIAGKKFWILRIVLDLCNERRDLKKRLYEAEGEKNTKMASKMVQKAPKQANEDYIDIQFEEIKPCLNKNNSKKAYQLVKYLNSEKLG